MTLGTFNLYGFMQTAPSRGYIKAGSSGPGLFTFRRKSMRQTTIKWFFYVMLSVVLIIACAGTKLSRTWVDETYRGKLVSNILVIGVTYKEKEAVRLWFEDKFAVQLRAAGVEAISIGDAISIPKDLE
jgi:hypothetical protein